MKIKIPSTIDIDLIRQKWDKKTDHVLWLIYHIAKRHSYTDNPNFYVGVPQTSMKILGQQNKRWLYLDVIPWMCEQTQVSKYVQKEWLQFLKFKESEDPAYSRKLGISKSYKLSYFLLNQPWVDYELSDPYLIRKLEYKPSPEQDPNILSRHTRQQQKRLIIDFDGYEKYLSKTYKHMWLRLRRELIADTYKKGKFSVSISKKNSRLFSTFTNTPKDMRPFMSFGDSAMFEIDLKTSHLFHLYHQYYKTREFDQNFVEQISVGDVYEYLAVKTGSTRARVKEDILKFLSISKTKEFNKQEFTKRYEHIEKEFPKLFDLVTELHSRKTYLNDMLTTLEAKSLVHSIYKTLITQDEYIPLLTLHDAFYTTFHEIEKIKGEIYKFYRPLIPKIEVSKCS